MISKLIRWLTSQVKSLVSTIGNSIKSRFMSEDDDSFSEPKTDELEPLDSPPVLVTPVQDATISQSTRCYIRGHARRKVALMDPFTLKYISPTGSTDQYGDCELTITSYVAPGLNYLTAELWDGGDWYMGTLVRRVSVLASTQGEGIEESPVSAELLEANERSNNRGYSRPFFYNRQQGERVESRPSIGAGGHARSWLWIIDAITGGDLSLRKQTDGTGDTTFELLKDLKPGINDLMLRLEGHGSWYMHSQALRVVVLPKPVTQNQTVNSQSATVTGSGGVEGAEISVDNATGTINYGKDPVRQGGSWSVMCRNLPIGDVSISTRQRIVQRFVENTYSERTVSNLRVQIVPIIDTPKEGETFKLDGKPLSIQGSGAAVGYGYGYKVRIKQVRGVDFGLADVASDGTWRKEIDPGDITGSFRFYARHDELGDTGWSSIRTINLLSATPPQLIIKKPVGTQSHDWPTEISGLNGIHNALVEVVIDLDHAFQIGTGIVQSTGEWKVTAYNNVLPPGRHSITARQIDQDFPSDWSASWSFDIRPRALTKVEVSFPSIKIIMFAGLGLDGATVVFKKISGPAGDAPSDAVVSNGAWQTAVTGWQYGEYRWLAIQTISNKAGGRIESEPFEFDVSYLFPPPSNVKSTEQYKPTISGAGLLGARVAVLDSDKLTEIAPDATVGSDNQWSTTAFVSWGPTWERLIYVHHFFDGEKSELVEHEVCIPPIAPGIDSVSPDGLSPTFTGTCEPNAQVKLVFSDGTTSYSAVVTGRAWSFQRTLPFTPDIELKVTAIQIAARQTSPAAVRAFQLYRPMVPVVITHPAQDSEIGHGDVTFKGTGGMKGATVSVWDYVDGRTLGSVTLNADGPWEVTAKMTFARWVVRAKQVIDGRESADSDSRVFNVVLLQPEIDKPSEEEDTLTRTSMIEGSGEPLGDVDVFLGSSTTPFLEKVRIGPSGRWQAEATMPVGDKTIRARQYFQNQTSKDTQPRTYKVVPHSPFMETPAAGDHIGKRAMVSGFGVWGDKVKVKLGPGTGPVLGETLVGEDRTWSVPVEILRAGPAVSLVATSSEGAFESDASAPRSVLAGVFEPTIQSPAEGRPVPNPVHFAGTGQDGEAQLCSWYNPDVIQTTVLPVTTAAGWQGAASVALSPGGNWSVIQQTLTKDQDGATVSDKVTSHRFEVDPVPSEGKSPEIPDKRSR